MKIFNQQTDFDYSWEEVSTSNWQKYGPWNKKTPHVIAVDTLSRTVNPATGIVSSTTNRAPHHLQANRAEVGETVPRRPRHVARLRNFLRRPRPEESHIMFDEHDLVGSPLRTRNLHLYTCVLRPSHENNVPAACRSHCVLWRMAEDQEQHRANHRGEVSTKCPERQRRV
jgi:hypothetical protein